MAEKVLSVYSPDWDPYSGYGRMSLELVAHLDRLGVHANAMGTPATEILHEELDEPWHTLLSRPVRTSFGGILAGYPTLYERFGSMAGMGTRVALTMFESTQLPDGWVEALNACDMVIVPSELNRDIFADNGVTVPIRVVPLGLSDTFHPENHRGGSAVIPHAIKRKVKRGQLWFHRERFKPSRKDPFVFLAWGDRGESKGWKSAIFAFNKAFAGRNDVRLIIKARSYSIGYDVSRIDNVEILQADLDEEQMLDLYLRCDAMVFPSHGEGFGFPPREFAATGGPVICTRWWADDIEKWGYPVNYTMAPAWPGDEQREGLGMWAQPDIDHLAKQMTHQYQHDARILRYMANRSAKHIRKMCNWERFAGGVWDAWQEACEGVKDASA